MHPLLVAGLLVAASAAAGCIDVGSPEGDGWACSSGGEGDGPVVVGPQVGEYSRKTTVENATLPADQVDFLMLKVRADKVAGSFHVWATGPDGALAGWSGEGTSSAPWQLLVSQPKPGTYAWGVDGPTAGAGTSVVLVEVRQTGNVDSYRCDQSLPS